MLCKNCGNPIEDGNNVCPVCGVMVEDVVSSEPAVDPGKGMGIASLVLGIASLATGTLCSCLFACLGGIVPAIMAVIGIVLGVMAGNKSSAAGFNNKFGKIGMILSIVTLVIIVVFIILNAILGGAMAASGELFQF